MSFLSSYRCIATGTLIPNCIAGTCPPPILGGSSPSAAPCFLPAALTVEVPVLLQPLTLSLSLDGLIYSQGSSVTPLTHPKGAPTYNLRAGLPAAPDLATQLPARRAAPLQLERTAFELEGPFPLQTHSSSATPHPSGKNLGNILVSLLPQFPHLRGDLAQRTSFFSVTTFVGVFLTR